MKNLSKTGYIYFVRCGDAYKIGYSILPEQRLSLIKTDNSKPVEVLGIWELQNAYEVEQKILQLFYADKDRDGIQHIRGEWFKMPRKVAKEFVRQFEEA